MVNSLLEKLDSEERLANLDNFTSGTKKIAKEYITELENNFNEQPKAEETIEEIKEETPIEKAIAKGRQILVDLELKYSEIEDTIQERINPENNKELTKDRDYFIEELNEMKRNLNDIKDMIKEIIEDIQEIQETSPKKDRLNSLGKKRKEYHTIVKNYPPIQ